MEKIVKSGRKDCTVTLTGSECAVKFDTCFQVYAVRNDSATDVYISKFPGIVPDDDGVMRIKSGASALYAHMDPHVNTIYLLGDGKVQVHAQSDTNNPFKLAPVQSSGGSEYDYGVNFKSHNIAADLNYGTTYGSTQINGEKVSVTIKSGLSTNWYLLASLIPLNRTKVYKLAVKNFTGYGRLGISSRSNGGYNPYDNEGKNVVSTDFNSEINDNHLFAGGNLNNPIHFMIVPSSNTDITNCGLWYCSDKNRDEIGTEGFTFELELYESEG